MRAKGCVAVSFLALLPACANTVLEANVSSGWRPAAGVDVAIECPMSDGDTKRRVLGKTDENGHYELAETTGRVLHEKCDLLVGERRFAMTTICVEPGEPHCKRAVIETDLTVSDARAKR
ncbi:MAG: hypothetical protein JST00_20260 [Deltaproteobacteria bacterium]|nr:hypothetical protein [Deltaproteobacteria bacterium]